MYSLTGLEVRNLKIKMSVGLCSSWKLYGRIHFFEFSSFCRLPALFGLWPHLHLQSKQYSIFHYSPTLTLLIPLIRAPVHGFVHIEKRN